MMPREKKELCQLMAGLFSTPDRETIEPLCMDAILSRMEGYLRSLGGDLAWLLGFAPQRETEALYRELEMEYDRLFARPTGDRVSLVESTYKPWTRDGDCPLSFARETGLLMGDSAIHMAAIFRYSGVEVPEEFRAWPDHLVLELELLSALYGEATDREVRQFIQDHLDWVPELKKNLLPCRPHPFYLSAIELLDLFLNRERERLEITNDRKKSVH